MVIVRFVVKMNVINKKRTELLENRSNSYKE